MFDWNTLAPAPRYFMAGTSITSMLYGYGTGEEEFISGYHPDIDAYHITYKDEFGKWHNTQNTSDWLVFDELFGGRKCWQAFQKIMLDNARQSLEAGIA